MGIFVDDNDYLCITGTIDVEESPIDEGISFDGTNVAFIMKLNSDGDVL